VICRDRASAYARAAREAAPAAVQAADRFHLCRNLAEAAEKTVLACASALEPDGPDPAQPDGRLDTHGRERRLPARQRELYAAVSELRDSGLGITATARRLGLTRKTVSKYCKAASPGELPDVSTRPSIPDPYKPCLHQRWNEGETSAVAPHAEIRDRGWKGNQAVVKRYLRQFRNGDGRDRY
jgi:Transposase/Helix-turn-helix domain of resolvase